MNIDKIKSFKMRINKALPGHESGDVLTVYIFEGVFYVSDGPLCLKDKEIRKMIKRRNAKVERVTCYG